MCEVGATMAAGSSPAADGSAAALSEGAGTAPSGVALAQPLKPAVQGAEARLDGDEAGVHRGVARPRHVGVVLLDQLAVRRLHLCLARRAAHAQRGPGVLQAGAHLQERRGVGVGGGWVSV